MIETQATVVKVDGAIAYVQAYRQSACGSCSAGSNGEGCGTSSLTKFFAKKTPLFRVRNTVDARVGDSVVVGVEDGALLKGSLAVYLSPLVFVVAGAIVGALLAPGPVSHEAYSILGAAVGLAVGFVWLRLYSRVIAGNSELQPVIVRKLSTMERVINIAEV
jgi:sigma-E factor negative regulatory protein RseC